MELIQSQVQRLNQQQLQSVELLQMSAPELEEYLRELVQENPVVELEESRTESDRPRDDELLRRLRWLESLFRFLYRQLYPMDLDEDTAQTVRYLAACLDGDGYLRMSVEELAANLGRSPAHVKNCLELLRSLEPAGVGAEKVHISKKSASFKRKSRDLSRLWSTFPFVFLCPTVQSKPTTWSQPWKAA